MDTVSQLKADVITVNKVAAQHDETRYDHDDEKYHDEKHVDEEGAAAAAAGPPSEGANDSASIVRKLSSKQELIVFSACCISLFRECFRTILCTRLDERLDAFIQRPDGTMPVRVRSCPVCKRVMRFVTLSVSQRSKYLRAVVRSFT
jgi:hypothetical protein